MSKPVPKCGGTAAAALWCAHVRSPYYRGPWAVWAAHHAPHLLKPPKLDVALSFEIGLELEEMLLRKADHELSPRGLRMMRDCPTTEGPDSRTGYRLEPASYPWFRGYADAMIVDQSGWPLAIGELKTSRQGHEWWASDGRPCVPPGYEVQALFYLALAREGWPDDPPDRIEFFVLDLMRCEIMRRTVEWDSDKADVCAQMLRYVQDWWRRHMLGGEEPPADDSELCHAWYLSQLPSPSPAIEGGEVEADLGLAYLEAVALERSAEASKQRLKTSLLQAMRAHDTSRITFESGPVASVSISSDQRLLVRGRRGRP